MTEQAPALTKRFVIRQENSDNLCGMQAWGECWSVIDAPDGPDAVSAKWVGFFIDRASAEMIASALSEVSPHAG